MKKIGLILSMMFFSTSLLAGNVGGNGAARSLDDLNTSIVAAKMEGGNVGGNKEANIFKGNAGGGIKKGNCGGGRY